MFVPKSQNIKKVVIAAAGNGTRMKPVTDIMPKELIPINGKPIIHSILEQCIQNDIPEVLVVVKNEESLIIDYINEVFKPVDSKLGETRLEYIIQNELLPYGNARPLFTVKDLIAKGEKFIYTWGDVIIDGEGAGIKEILDFYYKDTKIDGILTTFEVTKEEAMKKAVVEIDEENIIKHIVEKPTKDNIISNFGTTAPYLLSDKIFNYLEIEDANAKTEFNIQSAIEKMINEQYKFKAMFSIGTYLSNGDLKNLILSEILKSLNDKHKNKKGLKFLKTILE